MRSLFSINRHKILREGAGSAWSRWRCNTRRKRPGSQTTHWEQPSPALLSPMSEFKINLVASLLLFFWKQAVLLRHSNFSASLPTSLPQTILSTWQTSAFLSLTQLLLPPRLSPPKSRLLSQAHSPCTRWGNCPCSSSFSRCYHSELISPTAVFVFFFIIYKFIYLFVHVCIYYF